jgi:hypothetical protein
MRDTEVLQGREERGADRVVVLGDDFVLAVVAAEVAQERRLVLELVDVADDPTEHADELHAGRHGQREHRPDLGWDRNRCE